MDYVQSKSKLQTDYMQVNKEMDNMHISYVVPHND